MLGSSVTKLAGYLSGSFLCIQQILVGQEKALFGKVAENGSVKGFLETSFKLVFVETHGAGNLGEIGGVVETLVDEVPNSNDLFLVGTGLYKFLLFVHGEMAGFGAKDEEFDALGEQEQLLKVSAVAIVDNLVYDLLDRRVDGAPLVGEDDAFAVYDMVGELLEEVRRVLGKAKEGLAGELDAEDFQLEGMIVHCHVEILRVHDVMVAADKMKVSI